MNATYDAASIEVLAGLDPVRKCPGMYTDTTRPNHLAQEVVDTVSTKRSWARRPDSRCSSTGTIRSASVTTGAGCRSTSTRRRESPASSSFLPAPCRRQVQHRKLPVLGRTARGRRLRRERVVPTLEVRVKRDGNEYAMCFESGEKAAELECIGPVGRRNTGTTLASGRIPGTSIRRSLHVPAAPHAARQGGAVSGAEGFVRERSDRASGISGTTRTA